MMASIFLINMELRAKDIKLNQPNTVDEIKRCVSKQVSYGDANELFDLCSGLIMEMAEMRRRRQRPTKEAMSAPAPWSQ